MNKLKYLLFMFLPYYHFKEDNKDYYYHDSVFRAKDSILTFFSVSTIILFILSLIISIILSELTEFKIINGHKISYFKETQKDEQTIKPVTTSLIELYQKELLNIDELKKNKIKELNELFEKEKEINQKLTNLITKQ